MWKLLPVVFLLASCAGDERREPTSEAGQAGGFRVVGSLDLPLSQPSDSERSSGSLKEFRHRDTRGLIRGSGAWNISTAVTHSRLRCARYETGIQLGRGNPDCAQVQWLTDVQFGTSQMHCNSATVVHTGGGELTPMDGVFAASTCVRVVTRCDGFC